MEFGASEGRGFQPRRTKALNLKYQRLLGRTFRRVCEAPPFLR